MHLAGFADHPVLLLGCCLPVLLFILLFLFLVATPLTWPIECFPGLVRPNRPALKPDPAPDLPSWLFLPQSSSQACPGNFFLTRLSQSSYLTPTVSMAAFSAQWGTFPLCENVLSSSSGIYPEWGPRMRFNG